MDETGMSLGRWRQQRSLLAGLEQIATGSAIKVASLAAGYRSTSAFVAAFRKAFGTSPGRYLSPISPEEPGKLATKVITARTSPRRNAAGPAR